VSKYTARGRPGAQGPPNVNLGQPRIISETIARKLKLKLNTIRCRKILALDIKMFPLGGVQGAQGPLM